MRLGTKKKLAEIRDAVEKQVDELRGLLENASFKEGEQETGDGALELLEQSYDKLCELVPAEE